MGESGGPRREVGEEPGGQRGHEHAVRVGGGTWAVRLVLHHVVLRGNGCRYGPMVECDGEGRAAPPALPRLAPPVLHVLHVPHVLPPASSVHALPEQLLGLPPPPGRDPQCMFPREGEAGQTLTWERSSGGLTGALKDPPPHRGPLQRPEGGGILTGGGSLGRRA